MVRLAGLSVLISVLTQIRSALNFIPLLPEHHTETPKNRSALTYLLFKRSKSVQVYVSLIFLVVIILKSGAHVYPA